MAQPLKILEVNTETTWRGGERQTLYALKGFRLLQQQVEVLLRNGFPLHEKSTQEGFVCHTVKSHWGVIPFFIKYGSQYDIIHVQTANLLTFAILTKPFHKSKVVYTRRLDFVPKGFLTRWKYQQAHLIVSISTPIKEILERFGVRNQVVVPECVEAKPMNIQRSSDFIQKHGWTGKRIIGTTAALVQHKDPQTLVKAIEYLVQLRQDFVLLHFGEGVLQQEVQQMIEQKNLQDYHHLVGFHTNVEDFFAIFDIFVMSSEEEGLGSSVLDAFIYKVPVVSTNAGGLKEIVQNRGIVVEKKDPRALANALHHVLARPDSVTTHVEEAYKFATEALTIEQIHKQYFRAFQTLLQQ